MAAKDTKKMEIHTCYTVKIKHQLDAVPDRKTKKLNISRKRRVDDRSMQQTAEICLEALRFCVDVALKEWDHVKAQERRRAFDILLHWSKKEAPKHASIYEKSPNRRCGRDGKVVPVQPCELESPVSGRTGRGTKDRVSFEIRTDFLRPGTEDVQSGRGTDRVKAVQRKDLGLVLFRDQCF